MTDQLTLNFPKKEGPVLLETRVVSINKDIPLDVFMQLPTLPFSWNTWSVRTGRCYGTPPLPLCIAKNWQRQNG